MMLSFFCYPDAFYQKCGIAADRHCNRSASTFIGEKREKLKIDVQYLNMRIK